MRQCESWDGNRDAECDDRRNSRGHSDHGVARRKAQRRIDG